MYLISAILYIIVQSYARLFFFFFFAQVHYERSYPHFIETFNTFMATKYGGNQTALNQQPIAPRQ
jgi:hypothetical protein